MYNSRRVFAQYPKLNDPSDLEEPLQVKDLS